MTMASYTYLYRMGKTKIGICQHLSSLNTTISGHFNYFQFLYPYNFIASIIHIVCVCVSVLAQLLAITLYSIHLHLFCSYKYNYFPCHTHNTSHTIYTKLPNKVYYSSCSTYASTSMSMMAIIVNVQTCT